MTIAKIGRSKNIENIINELKEAEGTTEELVVLRAYRDPESGEKHLEWWSSVIDSRIWMIGALTYLANKMHGAPEE